MGVSLPVHLSFLQEKLSSHLCTQVWLGNPILIQEANAPPFFPTQASNLRVLARPTEVLEEESPTIILEEDRAGRYY